MKFDPQSASKAVLIETLQVLGMYRDELVIVGGSVPELFYPNKHHIGTIDVDLAVSLGALGGDEYESILRRLVDAKYKHQINPTRFTRTVEGPDGPVEVKLDLIGGEYQSGRKSSKSQVDELTINNLRGLDLALEHCRQIEITGEMPDGTKNTVKARIVEPEAFILVKAFALQDRQKKKDAYDIVFMLRNHLPNVEALAEPLRPLLKKGLAREGYEILKSKFASLDAIGPSWAAEIYQDAGDDYELSQRDAFEFAQALFRATG